MPGLPENDRGHAAVLVNDSRQTWRLKRRKATLFYNARRLSPFERWTEAHKLIELMTAVEHDKKTPVLLMGDINEWQWPSRLLRYLNKEMMPVPCRATFPAWLPVLRLDRIWHDAHGMRVIAHRICGGKVNTLSDHLPLLIEIM